jgi:hypothetical protein
MNYQARTLIDGSVALVDATTGKTLDISNDFPGKAVDASVEGTMVRVYTMRGTYALQITAEEKLIRPGGQSSD